jgi:hypothetical protein
MTHTKYDTENENDDIGNGDGENWIDNNVRAAVRCIKSWISLCTAHPLPISLSIAGELAVA